MKHTYFISNDNYKDMRTLNILQLLSVLMEGYTVALIK